MSRLNRLILCCVVGLVWLAPERLAGQEQATDEEKVSDSKTSGVWAVILGILAVIFVVTSLIGFCPLYAPLKLSTRGKG